MTVRQLLNALKSGLKNDEREFEAKQIVFEVLKLNQTLLLTNGENEVSKENIERCEQIMHRRNSGEPLHYILGNCEFYGLKFAVGKGVLIPRADTETLVDLALEKIKNIKNPRVLDLCSGTGCIAIAIAKNRSDAIVTAVEYYQAAYDYLCENIKLNDAVNVKPLLADALQICSKYDIVLSNPPYIAFDERDTLQKEVLCEPKTALFADDNGYMFYERIASNFKTFINIQLAFEVGFKMDSKVGKILLDNGYTDIEYKKDLSGIVRVVYAKR